MPLELRSLTDDEATVFDPQAKKDVVINKNMVSPKTWEQMTTLGARTAPLAAAPEISSTTETKKKLEQETLRPAVQEAQANIAPAAEAASPAMPQIVVAPVSVPAAPQVQQPIYATQTQTQQTKMGKEQKAAYDAFLGAAEEVKKTSLVESAFEVEKQKQYGNAAAALAEENMLDFADAERERMQRQEKVDRERVKLVAAQDEFKNFQYRDFFEGREGARVLAGFSMALGAIGSSITKGPNYAMQIVESAINNDLALQKAKYEKLKGTFEGQQTLYGTLVKAGLEENQADLIAYNIRAKQGIEKLEAMKSQVTDEQGIAKLDAVKAQLQQQIAAKQMEATKGLDIKVMTESKPIVMPSAKDQASAGKEIEEYAAKTPIKEAADAYQGFREFKAAVAAGATPQAVAAFIAGPKGLGQGSYGPQFDQLLKDAGLVDRTVEGITQFLAGGKSETLVKSINNFLESKSIEAGTRAKDYLPEFERLNERAGRPADLYSKQINPGALLRGKAQAAGLTPVRKP